MERKGLDVCGNYPNSDVFKKRGFKIEPHPLLNGRRLFILPKGWRVTCPSENGTANIVDSRHMVKGIYDRKTMQITLNGYFENTKGDNL